MAEAKYGVCSCTYFLCPDRDPEIRRNHPIIYIPAMGMAL
jgi:hypothetical protein